MRQPAPIKGERMETLLVQAIVDNTPIREDAPSRPDHRTEQHITVNLPDSIRHSSDSSRYLINRDAPIGGQAVKMSDIEADNYDIKMVDAYILSALDDLERKYDESTVSRKSILQITKLLKSTILGVIEDREASLNKVETWAYVRELQMNGRSEAQAPGNGADEDNVDKNETTHQEIVECLANLRSFSKHQTNISQLMLRSLEDVENNKFRSISEAMMAHFSIIQRPSDQVSRNV